eukprot:gene45182-56265_t
MLFTTPKFIHTALFTVLALLGLHCQNPPAGKPNPVGYLYENDLRMGGVEWNANYARIWEFSSLAFLAQYIRIEQMYERAFFRTGEPITVSGYMTNGKGGAQIDGIYLNGFTGSEFRYATVHGTVHKEPYPREYYSTADSPQGMFSDNKIHYRLVMENYEIEKLQVQRMTGHTLNVDGHAHFVWEFADSESYRLDGREVWTKEEEHQKITLEGILVQDEAAHFIQIYIARNAGNVAFAGVLPHPVIGPT